MPCPMPRAALAGLAGLAALLAALPGCGGGGEDALREVATLRARTEAQAGEAADLQRRVRDTEARLRALEEQVASLALRPAAGRPSAGPAAPGAAGDPAPADAAAGPAAAPSGTAEYLSVDTEQGRQRLREFLASEEREKQQKASQAMQEQMETAVRDRVTGYWTEQLGLDKRQQDALVAIAADASRKFAEIWQGSGASRGDAAAFTTLREKGMQIRQDALDQIAQTLTQDQNAKFKELGGENPGGLLGGGRGMGMGAGPAPPGFGGRGQQGGTPR